MQPRILGSIWRTQRRTQERIRPQVSPAFFGLRTQQTAADAEKPPLSMDVDDGENTDDTVVSDGDCDRF